MNRMVLATVAAIILTTSAPDLRIAAAQAARAPSRPVTSPLPPSPTTNNAQRASASTPSTPSDEDGQRLAIWNSPEMVEARAWVVDHSRRSKTFTPRDADRFLAHLRESSPSEMRAWLNRYLARQSDAARSAQAASEARQIAVGRAMERNQSVRQSYGNIRQGQNQAAFMARGQYYGMQQYAAEQGAAIAAIRGERLAQLSAHDYTELVFPSYRTRAMAAASLPGDLPRGDPRNFIRGDVLGPEVVAGLEAAAATAPAAAPSASAPASAPAAAPAAPAAGGGEGAGP